MDAKVVMKALNSCNVCDQDIKTPNRLGYCDDCLSQGALQGLHLADRIIVDELQDIRAQGQG